MDIQAKDLKAGPKTLELLDPSAVHGPNPARDAVEIHWQMVASSGGT